MGTFNPIFPNLSYFNEASLLSPQNHIDVHPSVMLDLSSTIRVSADMVWFWETETAEAVYRGPGYRFRPVMPFHSLNVGIGADW